jgi:fructosamine-3-kinase
MAELFGGFGAEFFAGYEAVWPLRAGYRERRRGAYQLYYLLVHVNLFGGSYVARSLSALGAAGG